MLRFVKGGAATAALLLAVAACSGSSDTSSSSATDAPTSAATSASADTAADAATPAPLGAVPDSAAEPTEKPAPVATPESYEHQRNREKHEFYETIDQSITADKIAGNPSKYVGDNVELHCTVSNVPQEGTINAACGDNDTNIVVQYDDTNSLDQGQAIRILGTVQEPAEGTNAMGGSMNFPTVKAEFME